MKIREIMRRDPITISDSDPLGVAQRWMMKYRIRHLPVVSGGHLTGLLSEHDVLAARAHYNGEDEWWRMPVRDAMQLEPQTANPDDSITEIAARMASSKLDAFPVVSRGKLVGLVTVIDVLDAEVREAMMPAGEAPVGALGSQPPSVRADQPLLEAVTLMFDHHVHDLAVVDAAGKLVGMLSEADVRRAIGDPAEYVQSARAQRFEVQDVMDAAVTVADDRPLAELAHCFADTRRDAVAVVDQAGALVGLVSYIEALHALCG